MVKCKSILIMLSYEDVEKNLSWIRRVFRLYKYKKDESMEYHVLEEKLPVKPAGEMVLGLETMRELMGLLDNPQDKVPVIHIAGTNGKGSVATFLQAVLRQAGYKVGLFTSP